MTGESIAPRTRIESVDVLRGFVIMLMFFVNDLAGVSSTPAWLEHAPGNADTMTIADLVFPAFLFLVGVAIPFALGRRLQSGQNRLAVAKHVILRSASLLFIGVLYMNRPDSEFMGWPSGLWQFVMFTTVMLAWHSIPELSGVKLTVSRIVRWAGIALLAFCVYSFRGADGVWLRHGWWGILGLIGWAYLIAVAVYAVTGDNRFALLGAMGLLFSLYVSMKEGAFGLPLVNSDSAGSLPAITVAGIILGTVIRDNEIGPSRKIRWALVFALCMYIAGWLLRPMYGISKIQATMGWCLWSSAYTTAAWAVLYWLIDVGGRHRGFGMVGAAGRNALFAYMLAAVVSTSFWAFGIPYGRLGSGPFAVGLARAIVFSVAVTALSAWAESRKLRLRL